MMELEQATEGEQEHLRTAIQRPLVNGVILRDEQRDLYEWCRVQRAKLDFLASIVGLKVHWEHEYRMIAAIPESAKILRRLKQDETIIALALWYDFDTSIKDKGTTPGEVSFTVQEFNEALSTKFKDLRLPTSTRMRDILQLLERKGLLRLHETAGAGGLADAVIHVLPTIRLVIPFSDIEQWTRHCQRFVTSADAEEEAEVEQEN